MVSELIGKYIWLIQTLSASGERGLTLREISDKFERRYDQPYSRRTFNNHRLAIQEIFGTDIVCDRGTNRYSIPYSDEVLDKDKSVGWLVNTFTVSNLLTLGKERLSGRVSVEDVPSGQIFLTSIMQAMEDERELEIEYKKYNSNQTDTLHIQPFAVKEHERRWYLVAYCHERAFRNGKEAPNNDMGSWRVYGLDRRATDEEARYLRDLPLHQSQKEEGPAEGGGRLFRLRVIPNENLLMEFCRLAGRVEVIEPESVRSAVREMLEKGLNNYKIL